MPRTVRDARLETRASRERLPLERYHWRSIAQGIALGYRRGKAGFGTWTVRILADRAAGRYETQRIGLADDTREADGQAILTYFQAADRAREAVAERQKDATTTRALYSVADAARDYLEWFRAHRKSVRTTRNIIDTHILPSFGRRLVAELTAEEIGRWHRRLAETPARVRSSRHASAFRYRAPSDDPDAPRRRKATANRILNVLRALLNRAWEGRPELTNAAWKRVKPFPMAIRPVERYLELAEARRLVHACPPDLRALVRAALLTGCRFGELARLRVEDYRADKQSVYVRESKSGKPRFVPLSAEGVALFDELTAGRAVGEPILLRYPRPRPGRRNAPAEAPPAPRAWHDNEQSRPLTEACVAAKIAPPIHFHVLRHTFASSLVNKGVPLQVVASALGHADTRVTERHYGHLAPSFVAEMIRAHLPTIVKAPANVRRLAGGAR